MIGKLKGVIDSVGTDSVLVDVGGVCFEVACSARTLAHLNRPGDPVVLFTETQIRDEQIRLTGFVEAQERRWFRHLTSVQGVGPRSALAILSVLDADELGQAIVLQDKAAIARAHGVGPRLAQRIVAELKDKAVAESASGVGPSVVDIVSRGVSGQKGPAGDAISALVNLGYAQGEAVEAVAHVMRDDNTQMSAPALIRLSLKELAR